MTNYIVVGPNGFVGSYISRELILSNSNYALLSRNPISCFDAIRCVNPSRVFYFDILKPSSAHFSELLFNEPCYVIITAGIGLFASKSCLSDFISVFPKGTHFLFMSSSGIYTSLPSPNTLPRYQAEFNIRSSHELIYTIIRPNMIYGSINDRNISKLFNISRLFPFIFLPFSNSVLQPVYIRDLVSIILRLSFCTNSYSQTFNIGGPVPLTFLKIYRTVRLLSHNSIPYAIAFPTFLFLFFEFLARKIGFLPYIKKVHRFKEVRVSDNSRLLSVVSYTLSPFEYGISNIVLEKLFMSSSPENSDDFAL